MGGDPAKRFLWYVCLLLLGSGLLWGKFVCGKTPALKPEQAQQETRRE